MALLCRVFMNFEEVKLFQGDELLAQARIFRNNVCRRIHSVAQGHGHKFAVRHHCGHDLDHWFGCAHSVLVHSDKFAWSKLLPDLLLLLLLAGHLHLPLIDLLLNWSAFIDLALPFLILAIECLKFAHWPLPMIADEV